MSAPAPTLRVRVDRVVLHGAGRVEREALAAAIGAELEAALTGRGPAPPPPVAAAPPVARQIARQVAPAVLAAAGLGPRTEGGPS